MHFNKEFEYNLNSISKLFLAEIVRKFGVTGRNKLKRGTAFIIMEKNENKVKKINKKNGTLSNFKKKNYTFAVNKSERNYIFKR